MIRRADPHKLAHDLLGRDVDDLEADEQRVLKRVASGSFTGRDADEQAQGHQTWGDRVAEIGGSWGFIIAFGVVLVVWTTFNSGALQLLGLQAFDAYPFIFLNLILSMLAAVQAPIILMSQNRQARKDRVTARHDYEASTLIGPEPRGDFTNIIMTRSEFQWAIRMRFLMAANRWK